MVISEAAGWMTIDRWLSAFLGVGLSSSSAAPLADGFRLASYTIPYLLALVWGVAVLVAGRVSLMSGLTPTGRETRKATPNK